MEITLPVHNSTYDRDYGKIDIAPRVMGQGDYDGEFGYLLAIYPNNPEHTYLVQWDGADTDILRMRDFVIISQFTLTK